METAEPMKFSDAAELSPEILKAVAKMGFQEMTPVQQQTLPLMMEGRDVIAIAPTGTGKTCAFGIPMLEYVNLNDRRVQELVLAPTRELSLQITDELRRWPSSSPGCASPVCTAASPSSSSSSSCSRTRRSSWPPGLLLDHMNGGNIRRTRFTPWCW